MTETLEMGRRSFLKTAAALAALAIREQELFSSSALFGLI